MASAVPCTGVQHRCLAAECRANVNAANSKGRTALSAAASHDHQSVADCLQGFVENRERHFSMTEAAIRGVIREVVEHSNA